MYLRIYFLICVWGCVYISVCMCVFVFVCICVCVFVYIFISYSFIYCFHISFLISLIVYFTIMPYILVLYSSVPSVIWKLGDCVLWTPFNYALYLKSCWLYTLDTIIYNDVGKKHMSFHVDFSECFCAVKWYLENMIMFIISLFILFLFFCFFYLFFCGNMTLDSDAICWR